MIKIVYFASIRERLGLDEESIALEEGVSTVAELVQWLSDNREAHWQQALGDSSTLIAINQEMVSAQSVITDGDEVAFFPPVTGG